MILPAVCLLDHEAIAAADRIVAEINAKPHEYSAKWYAEEIAVGPCRFDTVATFVFVAKAEPHWWCAMRISPSFVEDSQMAKIYLLGELNKWLKSKKG